MNKKTLSFFLLAFSFHILTAQEICQDSIDNDGDLLVDCADPDCIDSIQCSNAISCISTSLFYQVLMGEVFVRYDPMTLDYDTIFDGNNFRINAIGYNVQDGFIYGIRENTSNLVKVGRDGVFQELGPVTGLPLPPTLFYLAGDFDLDGNYYVTISLTNIIYKIDVATLTATSNSIGSNFNVADLAFNPVSEMLYGISQMGEMSVYDPATNNFSVETLMNQTGGTLVCTNSSGNATGYGAAFADIHGFLYFFCNGTGKLFKVDPTDLSITLLQETNKFLQRNDGAGCALADGLEVNEPKPVPTMTQWGLFLSVLLMLNLGLLTLYNDRLEPASLNATKGIRYSAFHFPFEKAILFKAIPYLLSFFILGLVFIFIFWGEVLLQDVVGLLLTVILIAYPLQVNVGMRRLEKS